MNVSVKVFYRKDVGIGMRMYEVTVLSEDMQTEMLKKLIYADDEDDALDRIQEMLESEHTAYGMCQAEEI